LFNHHDSVGTTRYDPACCNRGAGAGINGHHWHVTARDDFLVQRKDYRISVACADSVRRAQGKAVNIRAVKRGRIDRSDDIVGKHACTRVSQGNCFRRQRRKVKVLLKPDTRFTCRDNFEKLFLSCGSTHTRN
jgi:hypothetical protein